MEIREAAIRAIESEIVAKEGVFHVNGRYYANGDDAERQRRWEAERRVRQYEKNADNRKADAAFRKAFDMGDHAAERTKRAELFALDPICWRCGFQIPRIDLAAVLHFNASGEWRLYHRLMCSLRAVMEENARLNGICGWCEKPITADQSATEVARRYVHDVRCLTEFGEFTTPPAEALAEIHPNQEAA